jgi:hypothetical protein
MANTIVANVEVAELTKYGFKDGNGAYVGWGKQLKDSEKTPVVPGRVFEMELYIADSGKQYVNKVLKQLEIGSGTPVKSTTGVPKPVLNVTPQVTDWAAKDRSQLIGGLSHDAATLTAAFASMFSDVADTESALKLYQDFLVGMLKIRDQVK